MANRNIEYSANAAQKLRGEVPGCQIEIVQLNLASLKSVKKCALEILAKESKIDLLINNAGERKKQSDNKMINDLLHIPSGVMACPYRKTEDDLELQFQTNHLGHFLFTALLMPLVKNAAPSRIVNLSSIAHLSNIIYI
jgi:retinol dehydrogenase 12